MKKILVVDDEFKDLEQMKKLLEKAGYATETATNGAKALDLLKKHDFDMILIDVRMPVLSGQDLLMLLREKLNNNVPMLYVTVVPKKEVDSSNIDGFIQKPFGEKDFLAEIKRVFKEFKTEK